jgi:hypothetical protein
VVSQLYLSEGVRYDPHALSLYLASPAVYLAPLVIFVIRRAHWKTWAAAVVVSLFVALVPVQPSLAQTRDGIFTVGFFHRALVATLPSQLVNLVFVLAAAVSLTALFRMGEAFLRRWRDGSVASTEVFLWLSTIAFWLLMPFSFMPWEKYGLPLYMLIGALLLSYLAKGLDRGHGRQDLFGRPANLLGRAPDL